MRIISLIDDAEIIKKILKHLNLWDVIRKPPACANSPPIGAHILYDQTSSPSADDPASLPKLRRTGYLTPLETGLSG
jgi:hypothetical protein